MSTETEMAQILDLVGKGINSLLWASITCVLLSYSEVDGLSDLWVGEPQYRSKTTYKSKNKHSKWVQK